MAVDICYTIMVIGSGGTGTYFLKEASRLISSNPDIQKRIIQAYIVDGDNVEEKNLSRQCFTEDDIGRNKAVVMADVLNSAFHLSWKAIPEYVTDVSLLEKYLPISKQTRYIGNHCYQHMPLIIGCVDNHATRLVCEEFFRKAYACTYFDSANEYDTGECVFAYKVQGKVVSPCRSHYFPQIVNGDLRNVTEMGCEELNKVAPQHIFTNMMAGLQLCSGFSNLMNNKVTPGFVFFNPATFYSEFVSYHPDSK